MAGTLLSARDEAYSLIAAVWAANAQTVAGTTVAGLLNWHDHGDRTPPESDQGKPWARAKFQNASGYCRAIGGRRYVNSGLFSVQIFVPYRTASSTDVAAKLGTMIADVLKLASGEVEFFEVTQKDIGFDGPWFNLNVTAEAQFEEFNPA